MLVKKRGKERGKESIPGAKTHKGQIPTVERLFAISMQKREEREVKK